MGSLLSTNAYNAYIPSALILVWFLSRYISKRKDDVYRIKQPNGASWLWGHELAVFERSVPSFHSEAIDTLGGIFKIKGALGHSDIIVMSDPTALSHILTKRAYWYPKGALMHEMAGRILGYGIVWAEGDLHRRQREALNGLFTKERIRRMASEVYGACDALRERLERTLESNKGTDVINIVDWTGGATLDVLGRVAFRHHFFKDGQSQDAKEIARVWRAQLSDGYKKSTFVAQMLVRNLPILASLPFEAIETQKTITKTIRRLASEKLLDGANDAQGDDFLSVLVAASEGQKVKITKEEVLEQLSTFVIAGHETTSSVLACTLWELAKSPETQDRLREEIRRFGKDMPSFDEFETKLPFLDAVCREGLRLLPAAAPLLERVALHDDVIPLREPITATDGTLLTEIRIRAGQTIHIPVMAINRRDQVWVDGHVFRPERWLAPNKPPTSGLSLGWNGLMTFLEGPRMCIGYRLAVFELKALIFTLIRHFSFGDTGATFIMKAPSSLAMFVEGRQEEGHQIPLKVTVL